MRFTPHISLALCAVQGWAAKLRKCLSVTFPIDKDITGEDIVDGLERTGFDTQKVVSI